MLTPTVLLKYIHSNEEKKKKALDDQIEELNGTLKAIEKRTEEILQEREDIMKELDEKKILLESKERECSTLAKLIEINREKELVIIAERLETSHVACVNNSLFSKISLFNAVLLMFSSFVLQQVWNWNYEAWFWLQKCLHNLLQSRIWLEEHQKT